MARTSPVRAFAATALMLMAALAGCIGDEEGGDARFASYEEARDAVVETYEPNGTDSPVRLGLISPEDPQRIGTGGLEVVILLFDSEADEPITDASFGIEARMPAMGHGTSPETDPTHDAHGVYVGETTISMGGGWMINLNPTLADGTTLDFQVQVQAEDGGMDGGHGSGMDMGNTTYNSYSEAKEAPGQTFEPENASTPHRVKLLSPTDPTNVTQGEHEVVVLLFDSEADEPVTDANMTLDAHMPAMGHGTSPETDPAHEAHGVYVGSTNLMMNGTWVLEMTANLTDGTSLDWSVDVQVGEGGMMGHMQPPEDLNLTFNDTIATSAEYNENYSFEVNWTPAVGELILSTTDNSGVGGLTDEVNMSLFDPNGTWMQTLIVNGGSDGTMEVDSFPSEGNYTIEVTSRAVDLSYEINVLVDFQKKGEMEM